MFEAYKDMQTLNRKTLQYISDILKPGQNIKSIKNICEDFLLGNGADSFWYWDVGAFIFAGEQTGISISGKEYIASDRIIQANDIITIDLSPQSKNVWGDLARTIIIENGEVVKEIRNIRNSFWRKGLETQEILHSKLVEAVTPDMTFESLYEMMNQYIQHCGFRNLDFMGNLGHSIATDKNQRVYIEQGNKSLLSSVHMFTFEPHISDGRYGYKKENIYYFHGDKLIEL